MAIFFFCSYTFQLCVNVAGLVLSAMSGDRGMLMLFGAFLALQAAILYLIASGRISSRRPYAACVFMSFGLTFLSRAAQLPQFRGACPGALPLVLVIASALFLLAGLFVFDRK